MSKATHDDLALPPTPIRTPDQRLRVFVSSTLKELAAERKAVRDAVLRLRLTPVMFELSARPHPARQLYRAYLAQSQVFVGVYWQSYGWTAPGEDVSGLEDEYQLAGDLPKLIYVKTPAPEREARLHEMLGHVRDDDASSYKSFSTPTELRRLVENDLAVLLSERFEVALARAPTSTTASARLSLPVPPTPLLGREQEVEPLEALLRQDGERLITLTGPGGVGKSRLALEVGANLATEFRDGVHFIELATVTDAAFVAPTLARSLGLLESGSRSPTEDLAAYLREKQLLMVLDNFEQVLGAAPLVAELLAAAPGLKVAVTSRTPLHLSGESTFPVPPLALPEESGRADLQQLAQVAGVRLFVERAQAAKPNFTLTDKNMPTVAEIVRRLDGLPLAIELAAARIRLLPPQALLARLGDRLGLLRGGARDLPERQKTLQNALAWSASLLAPDEQNLFARLGTFVGGFDLESAEALYSGGPDGNRDILEVMEKLVDDSLVRQEVTEGEPRFGMLGIIRDYALECLRETPDWRETHDRHARYYLALAEAAEPELKSPRQLAWLSRLEAEHDNLRAAMSRFLDRGQLEEAIRLGWSLWLFWWFHGHVAEGGRWMDEVLSRAGTLAPYPRARALSGAGVMAFAKGDYRRSLDLLEASLSLFREVGNKPGVAGALVIPGQMATFQGQYDRASALLGESLELYRELGDDWNVAHVLNFLGTIPLAQGDFESAARYFEEGLDVSRRVGDRLPIRISLYNLALSKQGLGDTGGAFDLLREGLRLSAEAGDEASTAYFLEGLANLDADPERAATLFGAAGARLESVGGVPVYAYAPDRSTHDRNVAHVSRQLDRASFAAAWQRGREFGFERAVAFALELAPGKMGQEVGGERSGRGKVVT